MALHTPMCLYIYIYQNQPTELKQEGGTEEALLRWRVGGAITVDETQVTLDICLYICVSLLIFY